MDPLTIVKYPHPALRWRSKSVVEIDRRLRDCVSRMFALMYEAEGVGLAANQVALPWRLFVINPTGDSQERDQEFVFLNPEIVRRKGSGQGEEGCLSLPGVYAQVPRAETIAIEAFDLAGEAFRLDLDDFVARVVQHEYDHIEGTLFIDRVDDGAKDDIQPQLLNFEREFRNAQAAEEIPSDELLVQRLKDLEPSDA